nr:ribonuclease H-like domain-containing protein [Tanacetum cinerariifolium]
MNQFCDMKGIKREFNIAKTPQQNGVAERKNITLIEAARTMLVDSKLPTTFGVKAVNTACYVLNRALVIKPHNKTPYKLICGRPPLIDFMKPFGCHVTILNTQNYLGKFDEKADERFFVRYSMVSKAMRVFNKRTRIIEETLNIRFLENVTNVKGNRPDWLSDIDSLTISMNYVPVVVRFQTNGIVGTKDNVVAGQAEKKKEDEQKYILIPICITDPFPKDSAVDAGKKVTKVDESQVSDNGRKDDQVTRSKFEGLLQQERQSGHINSTNSFNIVSSPVNTAGLVFVNAALPSPINAIYKSQRTHKWYQSHLENFAKEEPLSIHKRLFSVSIESLSPQVVSATKLPILNPNEFDLWKTRIEQYFLMTDYSLWEVIPDGDSPIPTRVIDDAKTLMEAIEKRFGGNKETKKVRKTLLKQQYENFFGSSSESLDQIHNRLQKLISQLEILVIAVASVSAISTKVLVSALLNVDTLIDAPYIPADSNSFVSADGNSQKNITSDTKGNIIITPPVTVEEHIQVQREEKARTILLTALPDEHMGDFYHMIDAKQIWSAIKARFGGNAESTRMRRSLLKHQFEEYKASEEEGLDGGYDKMQKSLSK